MQSKRINRNFTSSAQLKSQAIQLYLKGQPFSSICEQLKFQDSKRIYVFHEKGEISFIDQQGKKAAGCSKTKFMSLKEEMEYLCAQNLLLKKSIERKRGC